MKNIRFIDCIDVVGDPCTKFDGEKKYISTGAVGLNEIDDNQIEIVNCKSKPSRANVIVKEGDILFAKMQATNKVLNIDEELANNIYSTGFYAVKAKDGILTNRCLFHLLKSNDFNIKKDKECHGATQKALNNDGLAKIVISVPDYQKQDKIGEELDCIGQIINDKQKEIELLDELVKARFVEMFGDLINSPKYDGIKLKNICTTLSGGTPTTKHPEYYEGNIPWITTVQLGPNYIDGKNPKSFITEEAIKNSATHLIPADNILFGTRVGVGKCSINAEPMCTNQDINAIMNIDKNKWNLLFIKLVLDNYLPYFDSIKKGATILGITTDDLKDVTIPDVDKKLQDEFASFVEQIDKSKFNLSYIFFMRYLNVILIDHCILHCRINLRVS